MGTTSGLRNCRDTMPTKFKYIFSIKVSGINAVKSGHMEDQNIDDDDVVRLLLIIIMIIIVIIIIIIIIIALITRNILLRFVFDPVGFQ
jgi:heme/copper-type cytochrome/quinol oxidase subunit 2